VQSDDARREATIMLNLAPLPTCSICNKPVTLETSKTDEVGKAVHEGCYVLKVSKKRVTIKT
jgi:hypothetical protein